MRESCQKGGSCQGGGLRVGERLAGDKHDFVMGVVVEEVHFFLLY